MARTSSARFDGSGTPVRETGVEEKRALAVAQAAGSVVVNTYAYNHPVIVQTSCAIEPPLGAFGGVDGIEPRVQVNHPPVLARRAGVEKGVINTGHSGVA